MKTVILAAAVLFSAYPVTAKPNKNKAIQADVTEGCVSVKNILRNKMAGISANASSACSDVVTITVIAAFFNKDGSQKYTSFSVVLLAPGVTQQVFIDEPENLWPAKTAKIIKVGVGSPADGLIVMTKQN